MSRLLKVDRICLASELHALEDAGANMFCFSVCEHLPSDSAFQASPRDLKIEEAVDLARRTTQPCGVEILSLEDMDNAWNYLHHFAFVQFSAPMLVESGFPEAKIVSRLRQASKAICYTHLQYVRELSDDFWLEPLREIDCQAASVFQLDLQLSALGWDANLKQKLKTLCGNYPLMLVAEKETPALLSALKNLRGVSFVLDDLSGQCDESSPVMPWVEVLENLAHYKDFAEANPT